MRCPKCEAELREEARFCDQCGKRLRVVRLAPVILRFAGTFGANLRHLGEAIEKIADSGLEKIK